MATIITNLCVSCGACEPMCPGDGIRRGSEGYVIDPDRCTECVGFHAQEQCRLVCPVDACCEPDPERVETEEVLFERALKLASAANEKPPILSDATSHFRASSLPWWRRLIMSI